MKTKKKETTQLTCVVCIIGSGWCGAGEVLGGTLWNKIQEIRIIEIPWRLETYCLLLLTEKWEKLQSFVSMKNKQNHFAH